MPASAVAKVTSAAPPMAAHGVRVVAVWAKASRPQGNPPSGIRSRSASCATQRQANHRGHQARRLTSAHVTAMSAIQAAHNPLSRIHASGPTTLIQRSRIPKDTDP